MRNLLVTLAIVALSMFFTCQLANAANELIGFDANSAAVLRVIVVNAMDGTSLNINTLVFEDYNGTTANYYITPHTLSNDAAMGIWKADMPASTPACSYHTLWEDQVLVNKLVYQSPRERWSGTAKIFDTNSIPVILAQTNLIPASPAAVGSAMTLDGTTHTLIQTDVNTALNTTANAAVIQTDINVAMGTSANKTLRQADVNTALIAQHVTNSGDANGVNVGKIYDVNAMQQIESAARKGSHVKGNPLGTAYSYSVANDSNT